MFDDKNLDKLTKDDEDYRANKIPRPCACGAQIFQKDYRAHLDKVHTKRDGKAPAEVKAPVV